MTVPSPPRSLGATAALAAALFGAGAFIATDPPPAVRADPSYAPGLPVQADEEDGGGCGGWRRAGITGRCS
ncbi:hypothetical protein [Dactylosporangium sp. NPDC051541]|uniref:hypothetical protein n=1 Tax=Dactylosporangium sp. NPDC051541 TaxID=3363977 RepID=UPI0037949057